MSKSLTTCTSTDMNVDFKTPGVEWRQPLHLTSIAHDLAPHHATRLKVVPQPRSITGGALSTAAFRPLGVFQCIENECFAPRRV